MDQDTLTNLFRLKLDCYPESLAASIAAARPEACAEVVHAVSRGEAQGTFGMRCACHVARMLASQHDILLSTDAVAEAASEIQGADVMTHGTLLFVAGVAVQRLTDNRLLWFPVEAASISKAVVAGHCVGVGLRWDQGFQNDHDDMAVSDPRRPMPQTSGHAILLQGWRNEMGFIRPAPFRWRDPWSWFSNVVSTEPGFRAINPKREQDGWWERDAWVPCADVLSALMHGHGIIIVKQEEAWQ